MWKFAETNWSILAGHVCTPFVIEQKRNIFSGKWEHKYHKLAWSIWPLDLLHMYHHLWVVLVHIDHSLQFTIQCWNVLEINIWVIVWNPTKQNSRKRVCEFCSIHTKYKYRRGVTCKTMEHWLVLLATLNVTGKEELLAKRVQSVVLFTPRARPQFSPICRRLVAPMQHKLVTDFLKNIAQNVHFPSLWDIWYSKLEHRYICALTILSSLKSYHLNSPSLLWQKMYLKLTFVAEYHISLYFVGFK